MTEYTLNSNLGQIMPILAQWLEVVNRFLKETKFAFNNQLNHCKLDYNQMFGRRGFKCPLLLLTFLLRLANH